MKTQLQLTFFLLLAATISFAQKKVLDIGAEFQIYPTGYIPGVRAEKSFSKNDVATARFGYQIIDHRDQGKHDDETGVGYGGSIGYKHYFWRYFRGPSLSIRSDFWVNKIEWVTINGPNDLTTGNTGIFVVQPTAEFGWTFTIGEHFVLTPTVAMGFEKNVKTKGEPTGEGMIMLGGIIAMYRIW